MNRIVIIGNGFDLAHGLLTKYEHFIEYLKDEYVAFIKKDLEKDTISDHKFFCLMPKVGSFKKSTEHDRRYHCSTRENLKTWADIEKFINVEYRAVSEWGSGSDKYYQPKIKFRNTLLSSSFHNSLETTWGGIENDYKDALIKIIANSGAYDQAQLLNHNLKDIIDELVAYLSELKIPVEYDENIASKLYTRPLLEWRGKINDVEKLGIPRFKIDSNEDRKLENILFLNFNYTSTINNYRINSSPQGESIRNFLKSDWISDDVHTSVRYIHGDLYAIESNPIIFGYGDEQDEHQVILEKMNNEFFKHIKSVQYTRTPYYREMIDFADADRFDIVIYGHSCSNTDRTLLNTLFEHDNCISIQPYLYDIKDGSIYNNIYRCFKDKKLMRSRVVDQTNTISCRS